MQEVHSCRKPFVPVTISVRGVLHPVPPVAHLPIFPHGVASEKVDVLVSGQPSGGGAAVSTGWGWKASETSAGSLLRQKPTLFVHSPYLFELNEGEAVRD